MAQVWLGAVTVYSCATVLISLIPSIDCKVQHVYTIFSFMKLL